MKEKAAESLQNKFPFRVLKTQRRSKWHSQFWIPALLVPLCLVYLSCYSMYGVNSRDCSLNLNCGENCLSSYSSLVMDKEGTVQLLGFNLRKRGESACGLGLGGPCFLPLIPFPILGSSDSEISITALPGPPENRVTSVELINLNHATMAYDLFFDAGWDYTLKPRGEGQIALKVNENYLDFWLPADGLTIEAVHFNFENGDRISMHDVTLEVETNYGLILVLHHNVATGNPKQRIGIISEPCLRR